jgi:hypothetical protein
MSFTIFYQSQALPFSDNNFGPISDYGQPVCSITRTKLSALAARRSRCKALSLQGALAARRSRCKALSLQGALAARRSRCKALSLQGAFAARHSRCKALSLQGPRAARPSRCKALSLQGALAAFFTMNPMQCYGTPCTLKKYLFLMPFTVFSQSLEHQGVALL